MSTWNNFTRQVLAFGDLIREKSHEGQEEVFWFLSVVQNAIVLWNALALNKAIDAARRDGHAITEADLLHALPTLVEHINFVGRFDLTTYGAARPSGWQREATVYIREIGVFYVMFFFGCFYRVALWCSVGRNRTFLFIYSVLELRPRSAFRALPPFGFPDISYLDITTMRTLAYLRFTVRSRVAARFPRHKLAGDGTNFGPGQAIVTPSSIRAEILALFRQWEGAGLVEGFEQFKTELVVERNKTDPNRVDAVIPPDLINQLRVFAGQVQFLL